MDCYMKYSGKHEVSNLLLKYEQLCCKEFEKLKNISRMISTDIKLKMSHLQEERNMWRLLRTLFQVRVESENVVWIKKYREKKYIHERDSYVRESQLIIDWLEENYFDDNEELLAKISHHFKTNRPAFPDFSGISMQLSELQIHLDPDVYQRQRNDSLDETDRADEARFVKYLFICIRAGKLDQAQQLALKIKEPCLAAALKNLQPYHNPNCDKNMVGGQGLLPVESKDRDVWKLACWPASESLLFDFHYLNPNYIRAAYGSLCGNLKAIIPVCKSWEDYLWAYVVSSQNKLMKKEIFSKPQETLGKLPVEYWNNILVLEEIFQELETSDSIDVKSQSKDPLHIMQKYIILDDLDGLVEEMYNWLSNEKLEGSMLRSMVHLILFFRVVGHSTKEELCVPILEAYVQELMKAHKTHVVSKYASTLRKEEQSFWYARFIEDITDNGERQKCLQFAEDAGLDVAEIITTVVNNCKNTPVNDLQMTELSALITEDDMKKVNAIDWLIFYPAQRAKALKQANALMRIFVAQKRIRAALKACNKVPPDTYNILTELARAKGHKAIAADDSIAYEEYSSFKAYFDAIAAFYKWLHHLNCMKPAKPVKPSGDLSYRAKIFHDYNLKHFENSISTWSNVEKTLGTTASESCYKVLQFSGGWLVDHRSDGAVDESRKALLSSLRKQCLPEICNLLQELLIKQKKGTDLYHLAGVITSERYQLYKEFTPEDLKLFLKVCMDSAIGLLKI